MGASILGVCCYSEGHNAALECPTASSKSQLGKNLPSLGQKPICRELAVSFTLRSLT